MKLNIYKLIKLFENTSDLFDDPEIFSHEDDSLLDNEAARKLWANNLDLILTDLFGTDKPRGWKKAKDADGYQIVQCINNKANYTHKFLDDIINILKNKGYKEYKSSEYTYAFINNITVMSYLNTSWNKEWCIKQNNNLEEWKLKVFPFLPQLVKELFTTDPTYKRVLLSPDEGIILTVLNPTNAYKDPMYSYHNGQHFCIATIRLTGKQTYEEMSYDKAHEIQNNTKDNNSKIRFMTARYNKIGSLHVIKLFVINDSGYPEGITYFNWDDNIKESSTSKKHNILDLINDLLKFDFYPLNSLEKDDDTVYELEKDGLIFKFYKNCDCSKADKLNTLVSRHKDTCIPDSKVICELEDYTKELYEDLYLNKKR